MSEESADKDRRVEKPVWTRAWSETKALAVFATRRLHCWLRGHDLVQIQNPPEVEYDGKLVCSRCDYYEISIASATETNDEGENHV